MTQKKQVDKSHYEFATYINKQRWNSIWHQVDEVSGLHPKNVLDIGPGPGLFKSVSATFGMSVDTLDLDVELKPDYVGSATDLPFKDDSYDVVCAFQMLEHLPYESSLLALSEMRRVCKRYVVISLPDAKSVWWYRIHLPKLGSFNFFLPRPQLGATQHVFDGEHYWEVNKKNYGLAKVLEDFSRSLRLVKTYRVPENSYHRFFVFEK